MKSFYNLIWGQCSKSLQFQLRGGNNYASYSTEADSISLLKAIRAKMTGFWNKQYLPHALHKIMHKFYNLPQGKHQSNQECYNKFNSLVRIATESRATIGTHPGGVEGVFMSNAAVPCYLVVAFLLEANCVN